jgi:hypothetical protein
VSNVLTPTSSGKREDVILGRADEGGAALGDHPVAEMVVQRSAADPLPGLEHDDGPALPSEFPGRRQSREAGADDRDLRVMDVAVGVPAPAPPPRDRGRRAFQYQSSPRSEPGADTASPGDRPSPIPRGSIPVS